MSLSRRIFAAIVATAMATSTLLSLLYFHDRREAHQEQAELLLSGDLRASAEAWLQSLSEHRGQPVAAVPMASTLTHTGAEWIAVPTRHGRVVSTTQVIGWLSWLDAQGEPGFSTWVTVPRPDDSTRVPHPDLECLTGGHFTTLSDLAGMAAVTDAPIGRCRDFTIASQGYGLGDDQKGPVGSSLGEDGWLFVAWYQPWGVPGAPLGSHDPIQRLGLVLLGCNLLVLAASCVVAQLLVRHVQRPVTRVRLAAEQVAAGDLRARAVVDGEDDLARLGAAVNSMADRLTGQIDELAAAEARQRRFVSDVAHELRTPTAALVSAAEALENPATRDAASGLVAPQLRRLAGLTEDLLQVARLDAGHARLVLDRVDLTDLAREVAHEAGGEVVVSGASLVARVDPVRVRLALRNLVDNGLRHGRPPLEVHVHQVGGHAHLEVVDHGDGVPPQLRESVFDRFVRGDESRHGHSNGLGLAIAREFARLHGGDILLCPDGRTFQLVLPLEQPETDK